MIGRRQQVENSHPEVEAVQDCIARQQDAKHEKPDAVDIHGQPSSSGSLASDIDSVRSVRSALVSSTSCVVV